MFKQCAKSEKWHTKYLRLIPVYDVMDRNYDVITFFWKYSYFKKAGVAIFAEIIKIVTMFVKTII